MIDTSSEPGGVKHHAFELARALRERGDDVTIVGPAARPVEGAVRFGGIARIASNGSDNRLGLFVSPWRIWRYFRRNEFDIVHVHEPADFFDETMRGAFKALQKLRDEGVITAVGRRFRIAWRTPSRPPRSVLFRAGLIPQREPTPH